MAEKQRTPGGSQTEVTTRDQARGSENRYQPLRPGSNVHHLMRDMPKPPEGVLRITLKNPPTWWERFKQSLKTLSPSQVLEALKRERQKILTKAKRGQPLTPDEVDFLNQSMRKEITNVFDDFKQRAQEAVTVTEEDDPDTVLAKLEIAEQLVQWVEALFKWMNKQIEEIFSKVHECGAEHCIQEIRTVLRAMLTNITGEDRSHGAEGRPDGKDGAGQKADGNRSEKKAYGKGGARQRGDGRGSAQQKL